MIPILYIFALCTAIDGDTISCSDEWVRLPRIDTPERKEAVFQEAKDAMRVMIEGKEVRCYVRTCEKYGRLLGECGTVVTPSLGDAMLERGLAKPYRGRR